MMKMIFYAAALVLTLTACSTVQTVAPYTQEQLQTMSCRQLWKESEYLNRKISATRYGDQPFFNEDSDEQKNQAAQSLEYRLKQVREASVQRMCTFG